MGFANGLKCTKINSIKAKVFSGIVAPVYQEDDTMMATLRVLFADRSSGYGEADTKLRVCAYEPSQIRRLWSVFGNSYDFFDSIIRVNTRRLYLYNFSARGFDGLLKFTAESFPDWYKKKTSKNLIRLEAPERFLEQRNIHTVIFYCPDHKITWVFSSGLGMVTYHLIQSVIPVLIPWVFENSPLTDWERSFLETLTVNDDRAYLNKLDEFFDSRDFRADEIRTRFAGFETASEQIQIQNLTYEIDNYYKRIEQAEANIADSLRMIEERNYKIAGIEEALRNKKGKDSEITEFFIANKGLFLRSVSDACVDFEVSTFLDNYDADLYETYSKKNNSFLQDENTYYGILSAEEGKMLCDAIFLKESVRVRMKARFILDFNNYEYSIDRHYSENVANCVVNPHFTYYTCFGNNGRPLRKALENRDYVMAVSLCINCAGNLNMSETQNVKNLIRDILVHGGKCLVLEDGTEATVQEAVEWLKNKEEKK